MNHKEYESCSICEYPPDRVKIKSRKFTYIFMILFYLPVSIIFFEACSKNDASTNLPLTFSSDTVRFDTLFTTIGSTTQRLKVYNPNKQSVSAGIFLESKIPFRINIDGRTESRITGLEIEGRDSIYIFVEATIDPQDSDLPLLILDSIRFETNAGKQYVYLEAYGQDAHIFRNETIQSQRWSGNKPYLIFGTLTVDTLHTLHVEAGVKIYFHQGAGMYVKGSVMAEGEAEKRIIFSGDRLEEMYKDIPGQWGSIIFGTASRDNVFRYVDICNGTNGIWFGDTGYEQVPALRLEAVRIMNMSYSGMMGFSSDIEILNSLVANCGSYTVGVFGGSFHMIYCTVANNYSPYIRRKIIPALVARNSYAEDDNMAEVKVNMPGNLFVGNSIVYGTLAEEISLDGETDFRFENCLLRTHMDIEEPAFQNTGSNSAPLFVDPAAGNFRLDEKSPAIDAGNKTLTPYIDKDIEGNDRVTGEFPDLGPYEYKEMER